MESRPRGEIYRPARDGVSRGSGDGTRRAAARVVLTEKVHRPHPAFRNVEFDGNLRASKQPVWEFISGPPNTRRAGSCGSGRKSGTRRSKALQRRLRTILRPEAHAARENQGDGISAGKFQGAVQSGSARTVSSVSAAERLPVTNNDHSSLRFPFSGKRLQGNCVAQKQPAIAVL